MNTTLFLIGIAKVLFGVIVGSLGIFLATRAFGRAGGLGEIDNELKQGNVAVAAFVAAKVIALGILSQHAVVATFSAMDLAYRNRDFEPRMLLAFAIYGLVHVFVAYVVGLIVLLLGTWFFAKLTRGVDEIAEIKQGNVAPALLLGGVVIVLALMTAPGLEMTLTGLLPLPELGRDELVAPS